MKKANPAQCFPADIKSLPYASRHFIVIVDDAIAKAERSPAAKKLDAKELLKMAAEAALKTLVIPIPTLIWVELAQLAIAGISKLNEAGIAVLPVGRSEAMDLVFAPGHPRETALYVGHPADPSKYFPAAQFHRLTFEHKFSEIIHLLMALGAKSIKVEHQTGWDREFASSIGVNGLSSTAKAEASAGSHKKKSSKLLYKASLPGKTKPQIPNDLVWFSHEPTWQQIADGRMKYGLEDFSLVLRYDEDYGVNAGLKVNATKAGLELGGKFEEQVATAWSISGKFGPLSE